MKIWERLHCFSHFMGIESEIEVRRSRREVAVSVCPMSWLRGLSRRGPYTIICINNSCGPGLYCFRVRHFLNRCVMCILLEVPCIK